MYKKLLIVSAFLFFMLVMLSCGDDSVVDPPIEPESFYLFSDYIHFDTNGVYLVAMPFDSANETSARNYNGFEPFVYYDQSLGEPFSDLNGNGVYDPGIDLFIRSIDSTNQDLNYDGYHNGPDDYWTEGIPFDDVNGDGEFYYKTSQMDKRLYVPGTPYFDLNNNEVWDSDLGYRYSLLDGIMSLSDDSIIVSFDYIDTQFVFESENNLQYFSRYSGLGNMISSLSFYHFDSSRISIGELIHSYLDDPIYLIHSDTIVSNTDVYHITNSSTTIYVTTLINETLSYNDTTYSDLLRIVVEYYNHFDVYLYNEFYFSKELGFIAWHYQDHINTNNSFKAYFIERLGSSPITMSKP